MEERPHSLKDIWGGFNEEIPHEEIVILVHPNSCMLVWNIFLSKSLADRAFRNSE